MKILIVAAASVATNFCNKTHRTHYHVKYCNFQTKSLGIQQWSKKWN